MPDSTKKIIRQIRAMGWTVEYSGSSHIRCTHPDAARPVYSSASPSSNRHMAVLIRQMAKALHDGKRKA